MSALRWALLAVGIVMSALGGLLLKIGAQGIRYDGGLGMTIRQLALNWVLAAGVAMYIIPVLIWIYLLKEVQLSFLQPLFSLSYVLTPTLALLFLGETVSAYRWLGIGVIILGVAIVART